MNNEVKKRKPELSSESYKIDKLLGKINSGDIKIPAFQRPYVWKQNQIIELLDSIINNYPIGSILLWESTEKLKFTRNIGGFILPKIEEEYPVKYVLDGQQRISSIYAVLSDNEEQDEKNHNNNPDLNLFNIYYNFKEGKFVPVEEVDINSNFTICLSNLLDVQKFIPATKKIKEEYQQIAQELNSKFSNYELPVVTIKYRSKEEVSSIFERINSTGTNLGTLDLMSAWTWTDDFHLKEKILELLETFEEKGFGKIKENIILQSISGVIQSDSTTEAIISLEGKVVRDKWEEYCEALKKAIDFLTTELNCKCSDFLPHSQQLIGLVKFFSIIKKPSSENIQQLKKWFWCGSFSDRYHKGKTTLTMNSDIEIMKEIKTSNYLKIKNIRANITKENLIKTKFSKANSLTRAVLLLMAQFSPKDLVSGAKINISKTLSTYNRSEFHHIFPNAFLKEKGFEKNEIFSLTNFCFLPSDSNKIISNKAPSDYFFNIIDQNNFDLILNSNLCPLEKTIYLNDNYESFQDSRAELILEEVKKRTSDD